MDTLFDRKYSLTIGRDLEIIQRTIPSLTIKPNGEESSVPVGSWVIPGEAPTSDFAEYTDFLVDPGGSLVLNELRIKANVISTKAGKSDKQQTTIEIYNLSISNQEFIRAEDTVILRAGYASDSNIPIIFVGNVVKKTVTKSGQDTITKLVCAAADVPKKNVRISKSPTPDETSETIAKYFALVAAKNGIPTGNVFVPVPLPYPYGFPASGYLWPILEEFCDNTNLKSYLSLGKLYIEPIDSTEFVDTVMITAENIKGTIRPEEDSAAKLSNTKVKGIEFDTFLDGRIVLSKKININYGQFSGDYKIVSVEFKLDSEGSNWDTSVSAERIG